MALCCVRWRAGAVGVAARGRRVTAPQTRLAWRRAARPSADGFSCFQCGRYASPHTHSIDVFGSIHPSMAVVPCRLPRKP